MKKFSEYKNTKNLKPINIFIGRFQPFTKGHLKILKELYDKNKLKTILVINRGKNTHLSDNLTKKIIYDVKKEYSYLINDYIFVDRISFYTNPDSKDKGLFEKLKELGYYPVLIGAGNDRAKSYETMLDYFRKKDFYDKIYDGTKVYKIYRNDGISSSVVRDLIRDNAQENDFIKYLPPIVRKHLNQIDKELN